MKQNNSTQPANLVRFTKHDGINRETLNRLREKGLSYGLNSITPFTVDKIVVAEWVAMKCRYGCNNYNSSWCCPPATPNPEKAQKIINEYSVALLMEGRKNHSDFYLNNGQKRGVQVKCWKGMLSLERMLFLEGYYKAFSLVGECCALCKVCAYPNDCRFPQEKRPSVESFSIDVIGTLKKLGITPRVAMDKDETYNYYAIMLLE
jgi:predicted metal-binding protein